MLMKIGDILNRATSDLEKSGSTTSRLDAEVLLSALLRVERLEFYRVPEKTLTEEEISGFAGWIKRRTLGEPVAYITGVKEFWSLLFEVNRDVLVPRPETEILVEEIIALGTDLERRGLRVLEIGTGSGAISVSLAMELPEARFTATDISPGALFLARKNARTHGVEGRIDFLPGNLFEPVSGLFDIVVSNPPYISNEEFERLPREVNEYEPKHALLAGTAGTFYHGEIIEGSRHCLKKGGWLLMEMGAGQRECIEKMLRDSGVFSNIGTRRDYGGIERASKARRL
jgi:release factor glutamine methyltransferase